MTQTTVPNSEIADRLEKLTLESVAYLEANDKTGMTISGFTVAQTVAMNLPAILRALRESDRLVSALRGCLRFVEAEERELGIELDFGREARAAIRAFAAATGESK